MLKKQTVWLLTMVSLMIVLSVYYMMSNKDESAYINKNLNQNNLEQPVNQQNENDDTTVSEVKALQGSQLFTTIRMELEDERNMKKDRLRAVVASSDASINEINDAKNEIDYLEKIQTKESILQNIILSTNSKFEDVLVRAEKDKVHVHVIAEEHSPEAAVHIMQMVIDELGNIKVDVNFEGVNG